MIASGGIDPNMAMMGLIGLLAAAALASFDGSVVGMLEDSPGATVPDTTTPFVVRDRGFALILVPT